MYFNSIFDSIDWIIRKKWISIDQHLILNQSAVFRKNIASPFCVLDSVLLWSITRMDLLCFLIKGQQCKLLSHGNSIVFLDQLRYHITGQDGNLTIAMPVFDCSNSHTWYACINSHPNSDPLPYQFKSHITTY